MNPADVPKADKPPIADGSTVDGWLVPPDNRPQRVADTRRSTMRLSALFEEFCQYLRVEKEAAPRSIETYRWCFGDFMEFACQEVGGTVLVQHFTADRCRRYQYGWPPGVCSPTPSGCGWRPSPASVNGPCGSTAWSVTRWTS